MARFSFVFTAAGIHFLVAMALITETSTKTFTATALLQERRYDFHCYNQYVDQQHLSQCLMYLTPIGLVWRYDRLVSRAKVLENQVVYLGDLYKLLLVQVMAAPVPVAPEVGAAAVASPTGVLELDNHSSSEADPLESLPPPVSIAPMVLPFLCSDDSESDTEIPERHVSPTTSIPETPTAPNLPAPSAIIAPSSEFPLAPVVAPPEIRRR
nr:hypothetical protein [Tanacetum cinerariifolium]